jgi:hypothetical protein
MDVNQKMGELQLLILLEYPVNVVTIELEPDHVLERVNQFLKNN